MNQKIFLGIGGIIMLGNFEDTLEPPFININAKLNNLEFKNMNSGMAFGAITTSDDLLFFKPAIGNLEISDCYFEDLRYGGEVWLLTGAAEDSGEFIFTRNTIKDITGVFMEVGDSSNSTIEISHNTMENGKARLIKR